MHNVIKISETETIKISQLDFKTPIEVELVVFDYTTEGTEYHYEGDHEVITELGHVVTFELKMFGVNGRYDIDITNIEFWINGEDAFEITEAQHDLLHNKIESLIETNKD